MKAKSRRYLDETQSSLDAARHIQESDDGKTWTIKDRHGDDVKINFDRKLPNGTRLTSRRNAHFLRAMKGSLRALWEDDGTSGAITSATALQAIQRNQYGWIYWVVDRGHRRFETVEPSELTEYLELASKGYDVVLDSRKKVWNAMTRMKEDGIDVNKMQTTDILAAAGLPDHVRGGARLPGALLAIKEIKQGKNELSEWKERKTSRANIFNRGRAITLLQRCTHPDDSRLAFEPDEDIADFIASMDGPDGGRTRLIPMPAAMRLMEQAAHWVLNVVPALLVFRKQLVELRIRACEITEAEYCVRRQKLLKETNSSLAGVLPEPLKFSPKDKKKGLLVRTAFNCLLPAASYISIGSLTARRDGELKRLSKGACSGTHESGYWLRSDIGKTLQKEDYTPCSALVVKAVAGMEQNRMMGVECDGEPTYLFDLPKQTNPSESNRFLARTSLQMFCDYVGASDLGPVEGRRWKIAPHQLRKLFAVLYVWRYDAGDIESLSYHLRHFNLRMTLRYCGDHDLFAEVARQAAALTRQKIADIAKRIVGSAGVFGKKLRKLIERIFPNIELVTEREISRKLDRLIKDKGLNLKATPWGFCACSSAPSHRRRAACQQESCRSRSIDPDGRPDPTGSDEERCSKCLFFMADTTRLSHWESACESNRRELEDANTAHLRTIRLVKRQQTLDAFTASLSRASV